LSRKPGLLNLEQINAIRQALHVQLTSIVGRKGTAILIRPVCDLNGCFYAKSSWVGDAKAQLTDIDLAKEGHRNEE
jgi:hypothetical protein